MMPLSTSPDTPSTPLRYLIAPKPGRASSKARHCQKMWSCCFKIAVVYDFLAQSF
jgi:hypothetical protein